MKKEKKMKMVLVFLGLAATPAMAADYIYPPEPPAVVVEPPPPPVVATPPESRCHVVRETKHDDILDTNDWVEHEECD
jgi:hypothetical protein